MSTTEFETDKGLLNDGAASDEPEITDALKFEEEEIFSTDTGDNTEENQFDEMIGALQDILIDPEFVALQSDFCFRNCGTRATFARANMILTLAFNCVGIFVTRVEVFENVTENKLIYTSIFNEYANLIESFLEQRLLEKLEYFSMDELVRQMQEHEGTLHAFHKTLMGSRISKRKFTDIVLYNVDEIPLDVIDVLQSCFDFEEFKSLMLSFKQNETPSIEITGDALVVCGSE